MLKIHFSNIGNIAKGDVELNKMTIFAGENNTGKTYATYVVYSLLEKEFRYEFKEVLPIVEELYKDGFYTLDLKEFFDAHYSKMKQEIEKAFSENLHAIFSAEESEFSRSKIDFTLDESLVKENLVKMDIQFSIGIGQNNFTTFEAIKLPDETSLKLMLFDIKVPKRVIGEHVKSILNRLVFDDLFSKSFLLPAERTGLNLFYQELSRKRTAMLHHLQKIEFDPMELIKDLIVSRYPQPIADYIDFLNDTQNLKKSSSDFKDLALEIQKNILHGTYKVEKDGIYFLPYKRHSNKENHHQKISLHLSSSTVKTFFSLVFYLEHMADQNQTLIIDEPELNLHPENQRKIARVLAMIANRGIQVVLSTHSDYFIREINNLMMLKNDFSTKKDIMEEYGYSEEMLLNPKDVNAYWFHDHKINKMKIYEDEGIVVDTFDSVIRDLNMLTDKIYYQKKADLDDTADK
jgi:predicted ATPase